MQKRNKDFVKQSYSVLKVHFLNPLVMLNFIQRFSNVVLICSPNLSSPAVKGVQTTTSRGSKKRGVEGESGRDRCCAVLCCVVPCGLPLTASL